MPTPAADTTPIQAFAKAFIATPHGTRSDECERAIKLLLRGYRTVRGEEAAEAMVRRCVAEVFGAQAEAA